jgi:hypothetical protein
MDYKYVICRIEDKEHLWEVKVYTDLGLLVGETACLDFESVLECLRMIRGGQIVLVEEAS